MVKLQQMVEGVELEVHITGILSPTNDGRGAGATPLSSSASSPLPVTPEGDAKSVTFVPPRADAMPFTPSQPSAGSSPDAASTSPKAPPSPEEAKPAPVPSPEGAKVILKRLTGGVSPEGGTTEPRGSLPPEEGAKELPEASVDGGEPEEDSAVSPSPREECSVLVPLVPYIPVVELYAQVGAQVRQQREGEGLVFRWEAVQLSQGVNSSFPLYCGCSYFKGFSTVEPPNKGEGPFTVIMCLCLIEKH